MTERRIINIIGPIGSGKTFLLELLKKRLNASYIYIDTDEIDATNRIDYIEKKMTMPSADYIKKKNKNDLINLLGNTTKSAIITGLAIDVRKIADKKYCISISDINHYRQVLLRSLESSKTHMASIKKLIRSGVSNEILNEICTKKYGIYFMSISDISNARDDMYKQAKKDKYKILPFDRIFFEIAEIKH